MIHKSVTLVGKKKTLEEALACGINFNACDYCISISQARKLFFAGCLWFAHMIMIMIWLYSAA